MDIESWVGVGEPVPTPLHLGTGHKQVLTWKGLKGFVVNISGVSLGTE